MGYKRSRKPWRTIASGRGDIKGNSQLRDYRRSNPGRTFRLKKGFFGGWSIQSR